MMTSFSKPYAYFRLLGLTIIVLSGFFFQKKTYSQSNKFFTKHVHRFEKDSLLYRLLTPYNIADSDYVFPLVIFLHGAGERGNDNEKQLTLGADLFLKNRKTFPAYVVFPQCPDGKRWVEKDWSAKSHTMDKQPSFAMNLTLNLLDSLIRTLPVDTNRIYVMGLSMGGYGTWEIICRRPNIFAAAVPICGGGDENRANKIKHITIWAFHGANDKVVPVSRSRNMIAALKKAGGKPKYTEYPNTGHGAWIKAFAEKELLSRVFAQRKKSQ